MVSHFIEMMYDVYHDCCDWWNSQDVTMIGQICIKVAVIGQNCKVMQNSPWLKFLEGLIIVY